MNTSCRTAVTFRLVAEEGDNQLIEFLYSLTAQGAEKLYNDTTK